MNVAIELPKEIAKSLAGPDEDLSRIALEAVGCTRLSRWQVEPLRGSALAGLQFALGNRCVLKQAGTHLDYTEADLECDIEIS
jgi:hypothetical protein